MAGYLPAIGVFASPCLPPRRDLVVDCLRAANRTCRSPSFSGSAHAVGGPFSSTTAPFFTARTAVASASPCQVKNNGRTAMLYRSSIAAIALAAALFASIADLQAWDDSKYPDLKGQWVRAPGGGARYDLTKPAGRGQEAPLTAEYQAVYEATLADQAAGGQGGDSAYRCIAAVALPLVLVYVVHACMLIAC